MCVGLLLQRVAQIDWLLYLRVEICAGNIKLAQAPSICCSDADESPETIIGCLLFVCLFIFRNLSRPSGCSLWAFLYLSFNSIRNTHVCHRLQPHLYPGLIEISLGRDVLPDCDISQRMSSSTPLSEPEIIVELRLLTVNDGHI